MTEVTLPVEYTANGSTADFSVQFGYISPSHVKVYKDNVLQSLGTHYTFTSPGVVHFLSNPANGVKVKIDRETTSTPLVTFQTAAVSPADLNKSTRQGIYIAHEARDRLLNSVAIITSLRDQVQAAADEVAIDKDIVMAAKVDVEALKADVEALLAETEAVLADVEDIAASVVCIRDNRVDTIANFHPAVAPNVFWFGGYAEFGDKGASYWVKVDTMPTHLARFQLTLADSTQVWYALRSNRVWPELFGGTASKATGDVTPALNICLDYASRRNVPIVLLGIYRCMTAPNQTTNRNFVLHGVTAGYGCGIVFDDCNGIDLNQTAAPKGARFTLRDVVLMSNKRSLYTAFKYRGATSSGGADSLRYVKNVWVCGEGYYDEDGVLSGGDSLEVRSAGFLTAFDMDQGDNTIYDGVRIHLSWQDWQNNNPVSNVKFPSESYGFLSVNGTGCQFIDCKVFFARYGFGITGQMEGVHILRCVSGPVWYGYRIWNIVAPSNYMSIAESHATAHYRGISFAEGESGAAGGSMWHILQGNLIFMYPGNNYDTSQKYKHIVFNAIRSKLHGNICYVTGASEGYEPLDYLDVGIEVDGVQNNLVDNSFYGLSLFIRLTADADTTMVTGTTSFLSRNIGSVDPVENLGSENVFFNNTGDKRDYWPATWYDGQGPIDVWTPYPVNVYGGAIGSRYQKLGLPNVAGSPVNHAELVASATGAPVKVRPAGSDTNIDLGLEGKGTGRVRIGPSTVASVAANFSATKYIEVKDSAGVVHYVAARLTTW